jgi:protein-tyrosine phosphatase
VGGYATADGRVVRHGRVFRSDSLASLSEADLRYVVATLGLRTAVDLRAGHEVDDHPHQPLAEAGVVVHHRPIVDQTRRRDGSVEGYLESHGLPADAVPSLRTGLLA